MEPPLILLPFLISLLIGYLVLTILLDEKDGDSRLVKIFLAGGLGMGLSGNLTFYSYLLLDQLHPPLVITGHVILLGLLFLYGLVAHKQRLFKIIPFKSIDGKTAGLTILFLLALVPVWEQAQCFPFGGWDAWQVWNFKAKVLFLGGENWKNIFAPDLWRTSPHYPLLLPLINVWGWLFVNRAADAGPLLTSFLFTALTTGLLFAALLKTTKNPFSILAALLLLTLPQFNVLATSQYCDIVVAYYILAGVYCLEQSWKTQNKHYALLAGLFLGLLSFTKPEGLIAAGLITVTGLPVLVLTVLPDQKLARSRCSLLLTGLILTAIPSFAFHALYSPGNQTFVNGLTSAQKPADWERLQVILLSLGQELISMKWRGIWLLLLVGGVIGGKRCFQNKNLLPGLFLFSYLSVITAYYFINTHFDIRWWLDVSLNRILLSVLPMTAFWTFRAALNGHSESKR
jgi:hypothetical protein